jgi:hypothetical protein
MKTPIALMLLTLALPQTPTNVPDGSGLEIVQFSSKEKLVEPEGSRMVSNEPPVLNNGTLMLPGVSKNEKAVVATHRDTSQRMSDLFSLGGSSGGGWGVPGLAYAFQAQMRNYSSKPITRFVWAYRPSTITQTMRDQEYLCNVLIEAGDTRRVKVTSPVPMSRVVNASASGPPPARVKPALQDLIINQVQFADGTIWQRSDWIGTIHLTRSGARNLKRGKCIAL